MKRCFYANTLALLVTLLLTTSALGQAPVTPDTDVPTQKRGQTGLKFLSTSIDARATAIGGAMTAEMDGSSVSQFYNPASMAGMTGSFHAAFSDLQFIADIHYLGASAAFRPAAGQYGVVGVSVTSVDYGDFIGTIRAANDQGFVETGNYSPTSLAVGLSYARSFTDRFAAGAVLKYAYQNIGDGFVTNHDFASYGPTDITYNEGSVTGTDEYTQGTIAVDFGVVYNTGFRSLVIGMSARNFSRELVYVRERFELPLTFQIGTSIDLMDFTSVSPDMHSLRLHVDAQRPRDFQEHLKFGLEYTFMNIVSLRGGFEQSVSEEQGVSLGAGLHHEFGGIRIGADYAYTDFGLFDGVQRIGVQIGL